MPSFEKRNSHATSGIIAFCTPGRESKLFKKERKKERRPKGNGSESGLVVGKEVGKEMGKEVGKEMGVLDFTFDEHFPGSEETKLCRRGVRLEGFGRVRLRDCTSVLKLSGVAAKVEGLLNGGQSTCVVKPAPAVQPGVPLHPIRVIVKQNLGANQEEISGWRG